MTEPTPAPVAVDPRPGTRPVPATDARYWEDMIPEQSEANGGIPWQQLRDGYQRPLVRKAELLPIDVNTDAEQLPAP